MINLIALGGRGTRVGGLLGIVLVFGAPEVFGRPGELFVRGVSGQALYYYAGSSGVPITPGTIIPPESIIRTGPDAAVDLFLGENTGQIRLLENSTLLAHKLAPPEAGGEAGEVDFHLSEGVLLGSGNKSLSPAAFTIKVANGVVGIGDGQYRLDAHGYLVVITGRTVFAHVPAAGEPVAYAVTGFPASYFSPAEGVRPAPPELVKEVAKQHKARLRKRARDFTPANPLPSERLDSNAPRRRL